MNFRLLISLAALLLPWPLRRLVLVHVLGYDIHRTARIGYSLICPAHLEMGPGSVIGHLTICKTAVEWLRLGEQAFIGSLNSIGGAPLHGTRYFQDAVGRRPELVVGDHAAITNRHYIDCTASLSIGRFTTIAGVHSIILTHSIDLVACKQTAASTSVGEYCFVGAACVLLSGSVLPDYSVLGANSLLNKRFTEPYYLYAGTPARPVKQLSREVKYFTRAVGVVD